MRVFLIHGMARTPVSMWVLKHRLEGAGHRCNLFGYSVTFSDLERITERFVERAQQVLDSERGAGSAEAPPDCV